MTLTTGDQNLLLRTAIHEGGHAVMALLLGARVSWLSVDRIGSLTGHCRHTDPGRAGARALTAAAGIGAELEFYGKFDERRAQFDLEDLRRFTGGDERARLHVIHTARRGLGLKLARGVVAVVAHRLVEEGSLPGERFHQLAALHGLRPVWQSPAARKVGNDLGVIFYPRPPAGRTPSSVEVERLRRTPGHWLFGGEIYA